MRRTTTILILTPLLSACLTSAIVPAAELGEVTPADAWEAGWPNYRGPRGDYAALDVGVKNLADPSGAKLLWKSEAYDMPRGKAWSSTDGGSRATRRGLALDARAGR